MITYENKYLEIFFALFFNFLHFFDSVEDDKGQSRDFNGHHKVHVVVVYVAVKLEHVHPWERLNSC